MAATVNYFPTVGTTGAAAWLQGVRDFIVAKDATLTKCVFRSDCSSLKAEAEWGTTTGSGSAYLVLDPTNSSFRFRFSSGTTANSFQALRNRTLANAGAASTADNLVANCRTSHYAVATRCVVNTVNATCTLAIANMTDAATADAYLGVVGATSQTNFSLKIGAAAAVDTGVAIGTLASSEHDLVMICDGTNIRAYIDLNTTAVATTLSANAANAAGFLTSYALNGVTTTDVQHELIRWAAFTA